MRVSGPIVIVRTLTYFARQKYSRQKGKCQERSGTKQIVWIDD
uniref:Uncharacterized protein n=1 Tax=Klebsiella pneumoniae TaxID=573 RepID=A0A6G6AQ79_KLEPN|nr:hypothetical protein [Klebsiella pneumoniae]UFD96564.1 hypothetical protein [Klebsiella oxytoca]UFD97102.1 hypothetical protein [Klebsiella pneumoniae]